MTTNINWTLRERDVVLQMAVFLYRHGRLRNCRPTHNEAWRNAMFVLPLSRRRNFTAPINLGKVYELYMELLVDGGKVDLKKEIDCHKELEFPEHMILADRISVDMIVQFGSTLDTSIYVPKPKKLSQQDQIDFLMGEVGSLQKHVADLTHALEANTQWLRGDDKADRGSLLLSPECVMQSLDRENWPKPKMEIIKGRVAGGDYTLHRHNPTHAPAPVEGNTALAEEVETEGDGLGDDPGAQYDPDNYSDMDEQPEHVEADPVEQPKHAESEKPTVKLAVVPEAGTGPVLYFYGCAARLRPSLNQFLNKSPIKIRTVHLDDGGKIPDSDAAMIVINADWMEHPTGRLKMIEQSMNKVRHVDGGWTSIIEVVRVALQDHFGLTFVA